MFYNIIYSISFCLIVCKLLLKMKEEYVYVKKSKYLIFPYKIKADFDHE